ncbi:MAG: methyltransferase [bacterium]|nr:methyltransferase [bacterium]MDO8741916.1 methyltransferase [bacterium]
MSRVVNYHSTMVPAHITDISALFLMTVWAVLWLLFVVIGRGASKRFPTDPRLVRYSSAVFICITFFYWIAFSGVGESFAGGTIFSTFLLSNIARSIGVFLTILGAAGMILSRWELRELTVAEVVFAKSQSQTRAGLYCYFKHPMYLGIFLILTGSFILYPNLLSALFVAPVWFFIEKKKEIEEKSL